MTTLYAVRVDVINDTVKNNFDIFFKNILNYIEKAFIVEEKGQKTKKLHLQGIIEFKDVDEKVLKNMRNTIINKVLSKQGTKGDYSFCKVRKTEEDYMIYLCKGGEGTIDIDGFKPGEPIQTLYQIGYTDEEIKTYRECALEQQKSFLLKEKKKPNIGKLLQQYIIEQHSLFLCERHTLPTVFNRRRFVRCYKHDYPQDKEIYFDKEQVVKLIARFFSRLDKSYREITVEGYYNLIEHKYIPNTTEERIAKALEERLCYKFIEANELPNSIEEVPKPLYNPSDPHVDSEDEEEQPIWTNHLNNWYAQQNISL